VVKKREEEEEEKGRMGLGRMEGSALIIAIL
jgi:hypothetical protein